MPLIQPRAALALLGLLAATGCAPSPDDVAGTREGRVEVYFNEPGTRPENLWHPDAVDLKIELIDNTRSTLDLAVMGFSYKPLIEAVLRAHDRGVEVRFVGDAGHVANAGYVALADRRIPMTLGNAQHLMHSKFLVSDQRFVMFGTSNWSDTDLRRNSNNFVVIDSMPVAADFTDEFEQMFDGVFGHNKVEIDNGRVYQVGDTTVEVWFSPNEDAMGRILELVDDIDESLRFTIFAFTKVQVGSAFARKHTEFLERDLADGVDVENVDFRDRRSVAGVIDRSQLHSNGQYHEAYKLLMHGVPLRTDGIDTTMMPGDYQAGGGRLHSKTMLLDVYGERPVVITGSFNWSASATVSNDELLVVMHGPRIAAEYDRYFESLWQNGKTAGGDRLATGLNPGDVVLNEIMWYGVNHQDTTGFDQFVELRNLTDRPIDLSLWQLTNAQDVVMGFPPGSVIPPNGLFTVLDHVLEPYVDGAPQDVLSAFAHGDLVINTFNDDRQARLYLKDGNLELYLRDPDGQVVDRAGDGGPAFAGGPKTDGRVYSMERLANPGDGADPSRWRSCPLPQGGANVNPDFKSYVIASPGEANGP